MPRPIHQAVELFTEHQAVELFTELVSEFLAVAQHKYKRARGKGLGSSPTTLTQPPIQPTTLPPYHPYHSYHHTTLPLLPPYHPTALPPDHPTPLPPYHPTKMPPYHTVALQASLRSSLQEKYS